VAAAIPIRIRSPSTTCRIPRRCASWWPAATKFLPFPQSVMEASFNAANELYAEDGGQEPQVQEGLRFVEAIPQRRGPVGSGVVENTFDNFMARQSAANKL